MFHLFQLTSSTLRRQEETHAPITVYCVTHQSTVREGKLVENSVLHFKSILLLQDASFVKSSGLNLFFCFIIINIAY